MDLCPHVKNILLLDSEGRHVVAKYYSDEWATKDAKESFEKAIFNKTQETNIARSEVNITVYEKNVVIFKFVQDLHFYVTGDENENELILASVLQGLCDVVGIILKGNIEKKDLLENLDLILLCIDEIVDDGLILETDPNTIVENAASHIIDSKSPLSEQAATLSQVLFAAREQLARSILR